MKKAKWSLASRSIEKRIIVLKDIKLFMKSTLPIQRLIKTVICQSKLSAQRLNLKSMTSTQILSIKGTCKHKGHGNC